MAQIGLNWLRTAYYRYEHGAGTYFGVMLVKIFLVEVEERGFDCHEYELQTAPYLVLPCGIEAMTNDWTLALGMTLDHVPWSFLFKNTAERFLAGTPPAWWSSIFQ